MKLFKILFAALIAYVPTAWSAVDYNIKYSSNYLMPAYVHFKADGSQYSVNAKIKHNVVQHCVYFSWFTKRESI